jgi:hypothetical protein
MVKYDQFGTGLSPGFAKGAVNPRKPPKIIRPRLTVRTAGFLSQAYLRVQEVLSTKRLGQNVSSRRQ